MLFRLLFPSKFKELRNAKVQIEDLKEDFKGLEVSFSDINTLNTNIIEAGHRYKEKYKISLEKSDRNTKKYYARIKYALKYIENMPKKSNRIKREHIGTITTKLKGREKKK